jgi:hypothetical protein
MVASMILSPILGITSSTRAIKVVYLFERHEKMLLLFAACANILPQLRGNIWLKRRKGKE